MAEVLGESKKAPISFIGISFRFDREMMARIIEFKVNECEIPLAQCGWKIN